MWARLADAVGSSMRDAQLDDGLPASILGYPQATIDSTCNSKTVILLAPDVKEELPVLYVRLRDAVTKHGLKVIEDAAEAAGSSHNGRSCGAIGDAGTFSFFSNKLITTGEGGMVVFRDADAAERARRLRDHGMDPAKRYWHLEVGYNYRLTNMQAALGCAQLEQMDGFLARKLAVARRYCEGLANVPNLTLPAKLPGYEKDRKSTRLNSSHT